MSASKVNARTAGSASASAPGKIILMGEHSVVYGRPAIAVPVWDVTATATVTPTQSERGTVIVAQDLGESIPLADAPPDNPLAVVTRQTLSTIGINPEPNWRIDVTSTIPIASGLGSGAAVSAAIIRAICQQANHPIDNATVSDIIYAGEMLHHGTPSGIDNTVIAYGTPVWFIKGQPPLPFERAKPLTILIGDSGIVAPTKESVGDVRQRWLEEPKKYEALFTQIGGLVEAARGALESGQISELGKLFNQNHALLQQLDVSHPKLDAMVEAARQAGAAGAKLSGGGRGGNMIALIEEADCDGDGADAIQNALIEAGAKRVLKTVV